MNKQFNPFSAGEIVKISPTTPPQQEILTSARISDEANTAFNEAVSLTIKGPVDHALLEACFNRLIDRHDVLRATFSRRGNEFCLQEKRPFKLSYTDCRSLPQASRTQTINDLWRNISISPMNLEEGPLFFAWLLQLESESYELIIAAHHIICDGWTIGLLLKELENLYQNKGDDSGLSQVPSFFEFAEKLDATQAVNMDIDYWRDKFNKIPPPLELPLDKKRPTTRSFEANRLDVCLSTGLVKLLPKAAAAQRVSLVNYILTAYFTLLHRLTGSTDIVVGLPVAGQVAMNQANLAGHMVQLLPLRLTLSGNERFSEIIKEIQEEVISANEHPNFTLGKLIEGMPIDRSRVPLISTLFNIDQPFPPLHFGEATATLRTVPRAAENFEMFLNILPAEKNVTIEATYSTSLFSEETISSWMSALETILKQAIENPSTRIVDFKLVESLNPVAVATNQTRFDIPYSDTLSAVLTHCSTTPDQPALISGTTSLTYGQVQTKFSLFSGHLAQAGVKQGDIVGICCERGVDMVIAALALFHIGAAYLPLDPDFPSDRIAYMLNDSQAAYVVYDGVAPSELQQSAAKPILLSNVSSTESTAVSPAQARLEPEQLAYMIYTSGSTGKPKGVKIPHRAMINFLSTMAQTPGFSSQDKLLAVTTLSFDISVLELFLPLICGGTAIIASREEAKNGDHIARLLDENNVTVFQATPATWRLLIASDYLQKIKKSGPIIKGLCGGEPLSADIIVSLQPLVVELWNMYGPTETTVWSSCKRVFPTDKLVTIGNPIGNTELYVLDENGNPLPLSTPGELFIGGLGLAIGYHERSVLTKERFIEHPDFGRIYKTGDLVKQLPNGEIQHLGRLDDQVKVRGYRVELGEIESALCSADGVKAAAVYLWELSDEDVRLVACIVPENKGEIQNIQVRKKIREVLPAYMVPQYLLSLDEIPLLPNGKIDRRNLPKPELQGTSLLSQAVLTSETEKQLAEIWTDLIKPQEAIGRDDNFFVTGGHSLLALEAIRQIEIETGVSLKLADLIKQNLSQLALEISSTEKTDGRERSGPSALSFNSVRQLSFEQERILKKQMDVPDYTAYNLPTAWKLSGVLDLETLIASVKRLIERQTALRTTIKHEASYCLDILHPSDINLPDFIDLSHESDPLHLAIKDAESLANKPFEPINQLLTRIKLYKLSKEEHMLFIVSHQLIFDGWSFDLLTTEFDDIYSAISAKKNSTMAPLAFEYRDYTHFIRNRKIDSDTLLYHQRRLKSSISLSKIVNHSVPEGKAAREAIEFDKDALTSLESFCAQHKLRIHEVLFAAFAKAVSEMSGQREFTIGMPVTGRYHPDVITLIGEFVSTLPFEVQMPSGNLLTAAKGLQVQLKEFQKFQDITLPEIINGTEWQSQPISTFIPLSFGFQDIRNRPTQIANLSLQQIDISRLQTELPIEFWTRIQADKYVAVFDYDAEKVQPSIIRQLGDAFKESMSELDNPTLTVESEPVKDSLWRRLFG